MSKDDTLSGKTIGKYKIVERLGKGGMAEVYKGYQETLDRHVAIKVMHAFLISEQDFLARFQREARAMAALSHPNIVRVYDFDVYGEDSYYLVMEYIGGGTLKEKLESMAAANEQMPLDQAVRICTEVADALAYAHRRQMVHRDIKPANIMLDKESGKAILTDFGIVKLVGNQSMAYTATGALIGTPAYMSPEQALGKPGDERVDIYALGVLLFQLVTNQLPFEADTPLAVVMKHVNEQPPLPMTFNPDVPLDLQEVILKALAKNPDDRYQSAREMATALRQVNLQGQKAAAAAPATTPSSPTWSPPVGAAATAETAAATAPDLTTDTATAVPAPPVKKRPAWLFPLLGVAALAVVGGILYFSGVFGGGGDGEPTTFPVVAATDATETPTQTATAVPDDDPAATPLNPLDAARTVQAEIALTQQAAVTSTPTPSTTPTRTPTATATVNATAEFLETCVTDAELVSAYRAGSTSRFVPVGSRFDVEWTLRNSGTCPWPAGMRWVYVDGDELSFSEPFVIEEPVTAGEEVVVRLRLGPVDDEGDYESAFQLFDADGNAIGEPLLFTLTGFEPATATPRPTNTPPAAPTTSAVGGQVTFIFTVGTCNYPGDGPDWRCPVTITPYIDGSDAVGDYTVFVFDQPGGGATEFRGPGPFTYFAQARRCAAFNQGIRVVDDVTSTEYNTQLYIDPDNYFDGGCVEN